MLLTHECYRQFTPHHPHCSPAPAPPLRLRFTRGLGLRKSTKRTTDSATASKYFFRSFNKIRSFFIFSHVRYNRHTSCLSRTPAEWSASRGPPRLCETPPKASRKQRDTFHVNTKRTVKRTRLANDFTTSAIRRGDAFLHKWVHHM